MNFKITTATLLLCVCAVIAMPQPDSAGSPPLPGPGLSYGGIPYGSMSGNVAEYFKKSPSGAQLRNFDGYPPKVDFTPIEQWLR